MSTKHLVFARPIHDHIVVGEPLDTARMDDAYAETMAEASAYLRVAVQEARRGKRPIVSGRLLWTDHRGHNFVATNPHEGPLLIHLREAAEETRRVPSRDPCPHCGVRADLHGQRCA